MSELKRICIIGGDKRYEILKTILCKRGYVCQRENNDTVRGLEMIKNADVVVLPVPVTADGERLFSDNIRFSVRVTEITEAIRSGHLVVAGGIKDSLRKILESRGALIRDFNESQEFLIYNACLTAQGALRLLLENSEAYLNGRKALITGFGRISKPLSRVLRALGMEVYVAARSSVQLCEAECLGYKAIRLYKTVIEPDRFDFIFNTVPCRIFSDTDISLMKDGAVFFELSSYPYGASKESFRLLEKKYISASALPGKYTAVSAAEKIAECVVNFIEMGEKNE